MPKLAIIGSGIAGLGCAHFLHRKFELSIFEQNDYVGGHTHTVEVAEEGRQLPVDTGFMVFNRVTYPLLTRLFERFEVPVKPAAMSFSVRHDVSGLEYCGSSLNHLFAQRRNLFRLAVLPDAGQHQPVQPRGRRGPGPAGDSGADARRIRPPRRLRRGLLRPLPGPDELGRLEHAARPDAGIPAAALLRFFHNHGKPSGSTPSTPGSRWTAAACTYVEKISQPWRHRVRLGRRAALVRRGPAGVTVITDDGATETFDRAILACHADQALRLLAAIRN